MTERTYKLSIAACALIAVAGLSLLGIGLHGKYEKYQIKVAKERAAEIIKTVKRSTVFLESCDKMDAKTRRCYTGTGFVIKTDYDGAFILTNKHVCYGSLLKSKKDTDEGLFGFKPIIIVTYLGQSSGGQIIRVGQNSDLCLIRTELKFKNALTLAKKAVKGSEMFTYGFPGGKPELNHGKYLGVQGGQMAFYGISDMKIWYGASGSPALDMEGNVIGVMSNIWYDHGTGPNGKVLRSDVKQSWFIPLEIVREFIGGL